MERFVVAPIFKASDGKYYMTGPGDKVYVRISLEGNNFCKKEVDSKKDDDEINEQLIDELVNERNKARKAKDFVLADEIRDRLLNLDIILEDKDSITRWKKKND